MNQLWGWKCNGQDEVGIKSVVDKQELFRTDDFYSLATQRSRRTIGQVTDLHKVKVVDADAVVIGSDVIHFDKFLNEVIEVSGSNYDFNYTKSQKVHECAMYLQYKIFPTPPVTKTYLTTEQFITVWKSLDDEKRKELSAAWDAARNVAWSAANSVANSVANSAAWYAAWYADLAVLAKDAITKEHFNILMQPWTSCDLSPFVEDWEAVLNPKVEEPKNFGAVVEAEILNHKPRMKWVHRGDGTWYSEDGWSAKWRDFPNPSIISEGVEG